MRGMTMTSKDDLIRIMGKAFVRDEPKTLEAFSQDHSYVPPRIPALVVQPRTVEQIRDLIVLAQRKSIKLVPVSSGPPRFRGDSIPSVDQAVVVDLSKMKKITWVNRRNRVALVEAGVTFGELEAALEEQGLRTMFPLYPRENKSVVGACMEREPFTIPKYAWDLGDPVASAEITLGDGKTMRTGGAAGPGETLEDQRSKGGAQKLPLSPIGMDVRRIAQGSQGSFGICSWISVRCELLPEHERVFFVGADSVDELIEPANSLLYLRLTDEQYLVNNLTFACLLEKEPNKIKRLKDKLPPWILVMSIGGYGELAEDQFKFKHGDVKAEARRLGISLSSRMGGIREADYRERILRKTSDKPYWKLRYKGDCREIFFLAPLSRAEEFVNKAMDLADTAGFAPENIGAYLQMVIQGNACHLQFDYHITPEDAAAFESLYMDMSRAFFEMGGYFSRPYGGWSDIVYPNYETFAKYARGLKRIFDPKLIMNPEKLCFKEM